MQTDAFEFNIQPLRGCQRVCCLYRGLHPRLFKLNPFGVNTFFNLMHHLEFGNENTAI